MNADREGLARWHLPASRQTILIFWISQSLAPVSARLLAVRIFEAFVGLRRSKLVGEISRPKRKRSFMKKTLLLVFLAAAVGTASARADIGFDLHLGGHGHHYAAPVYHHRPVVEVEAPPVVYAPSVVHRHAVVVAPAPVFVPQVVVYPFGHGHHVAVYSHHDYHHAVEHAHHDRHDAYGH